MHANKFLTQTTLAGALALAIVTPATAADDSGFFIAPEVLYVTFTESNFAYATVGPFDADEIDGRTYRLDNDYEMGYRLALGYRWDQDWDFTARWTHADAQSRDSVQASGGDYLFYQHDAFDNEGYNRDAYAEAMSDQDLDYLDLTVGRTFRSDNGHSSRFFAGLRWASFDQSFDSLTIDNDDETPEDFDDVYASYMDSDYTGLGIVLGAEGHLGLGAEKEWSLFGSVAVSFLAGNTDQARFDTDTDFVDLPKGDDDTEIDVTDSFDSTSFVGEAQVGVQWARDFEGVSFGIRFGWEVQYWSGIGTLQNYVGYDQEAGRADGDGDIGLTGGFLRASWGW